MPLRTEHTLFGAELKRWRHHRRYSQLELASVAAISQRHLSFLETGRSRPSPEMVEHLSVVLDIPLRARNSLLNTAGFADAYSEAVHTFVQLRPLEELRAARDHRRAANKARRRGIRL